MIIWALVPMRPLARAKSRLASTLSPPDRAALAEAMLVDVLEVAIGAPGIAGVLVVTPDPCVAAIAGSAGAQVLADPAEGGLNAAVANGQHHLRMIGAAGMLVIPADLPFITRGELDVVLAALAEAPVVVVPALRDGGTNLLGLRPVDALRTAYGPDSAARHAALARGAGLRVRTIMLAGAGHDVDIADDLEPDLGTGPAVRTRALVRCSPAA